MQLDSGAALDGLIDEAQRQGLCAIELRQGCLGEYEDRETLLPDAMALAALARRFAGVKFSLALACPFYDPAAELSKDLLQAGIDAAAALAPAGDPLLRLVDTSTLGSIVRVGLAESVPRIAQLAVRLDSQGIRLSLENGRQPWIAMKRLLCHFRTGRDADRIPGLCYDPANVDAIADQRFAQNILRDLSLFRLDIVHFKQLENGVVQPAVAAGDIDWAVQLRAIRRLNFAGPALFEIPASADIWRNLASSHGYIRGLMAPA